jgi:uncharacterized protein YegJ (DUF2314 family)
MKRTFMSLALRAIVAFALMGCARQDTVLRVAEDDQAMSAAIAQARATLPQMWRTFEQRDGGESDFSLKVKITDKKGTEHFWLTEIERKDGQTLGTINNDPEIVGNVKLGDRIRIPEADISDWLYLRGGKMVGNYTLRALFKQMTATEVERYQKMLADP